MDEAFNNYIDAVSRKYSYDETSEIGYRTDFENLLKHIFETIKVSRFDHDPKAKHGNKPDFVVLKNDIPILYIEAKDIGVSLDKIEKSDQMSRYFGYANLVLTDYLEFRFYRNGFPYGEPIKIGEYSKTNRVILSIPSSFGYLAKTLTDFTQSYKEPIKSGKHLAQIMGGKAQRIRDNARHFLSNDSDKNEELLRVYETIKKLLVHDLTEEAFADMYAQTLVYGLFVARFYDQSPENFTRQEARDLIPNSNPLLRHFFDHIVGPNFDKRLEYIVNELCEVFSHADVERLMNEYLEKNLRSKTNRKQDTVIHFYEDFLNEYDPVLRKKMGAYYTPLPVVEFIVRSVDELLKQEFGLSNGLADTTKLADGKHKVQVLDPAVGTGTFISAVVENVYNNFKDQEGRWPAYVLHDLLPRIHGFELMMAPYTIAHLKLGMALKETGFKYFNDRRLGIYLTNSLENNLLQDSLFSAFGLAESISAESKEAAKIKNDIPIMIVVGNPPYSVSSSNKGEWVHNLTNDYKKDLSEKNIQPLSDDYIKFIRFAEHFIEKNNHGIVAMITNNSFLDGIIHRQMRKHLLNTFDEIYILDLHGNSKKKETALDGGKDENVFDIQQGVSINIFVRNDEKKNDLGKIWYANVYGKRVNKFEYLNKNTLKSIKWQKVEYSVPYYFYKPKDFSLESEYDEGFKIDDLFILNSVGVVTSRDAFLISEDVETLKYRLAEIMNIELSDEAFEVKHNLNTKYFNVSRARSASRDNNNSKIIKCFYRPFDFRYLLYVPSFIERGREKVMKHMIFGSNIALVCSRQSTRDYIDNIQVADSVIELKFNSHDRNSNIFPLYIYTDDGTKIPNFRRDIFDEIGKIIMGVSPEDIFDYIYAVLHSPNYRKRYMEFLKIDFPRVPYPKDREKFRMLMNLGRELRLLHLLESPTVNNFITTYPETGSDKIEQVEYRDGKVYVNETQYFGNVPEVAWNFYIGGYQPAQKWLKDRKGRTLTNEEIEHYQQMIVALNETDRIMKEIDKVI